jgi:hypothetical protein
MISGILIGSSVTVREIPRRVTTSFKVHEFYLYIRWHNNILASI